VVQKKGAISLIHLTLKVGLLLFTDFRHFYTWPYSEQRSVLNSAVHYTRRLYAHYLSQELNEIRFCSSLDERRKKSDFI